MKYSLLVEIWILLYEVWKLLVLFTGFARFLFYYSIWRNMLAPRLALLALLHFYRSYRNLLKIHPWAMNKKLLKEGSGHIFESCDISLKNTHTSYTCSYPSPICSDSAMPHLSCTCLCSNSMYCGTNNWAYFEKKATFATTTFKK